MDNLERWSRRQVLQKLSEVRGDGHEYWLLNITTTHRPNHMTDCIRQALQQNADADWKIINKAPNQAHPNTYICHLPTTNDDNVPAETERLRIMQALRADQRVLDHQPPPVVSLILSKAQIYNQEFHDELERWRQLPGYVEDDDPQ